MIHKKQKGLTIEKLSSRVSDSVLKTKKSSKVELIALFTGLICLAAISFFVNQYILERKLMMWIVPTLTLIISFIGFAVYFSKKSSLSLMVLKTLAASVLTALASLYLFLVLTFNSAWT